MPKKTWKVPFASKSNTHKRFEHSWVAYCDERGNEIFGYCDACGVVHGSDGDVAGEIETLEAKRLFEEQEEKMRKMHPEYYKE